MTKILLTLCFVFLLCFTPKFVSPVNVPVSVGLVLDMKAIEDEMAMSCISMALSDFYTTHSHFNTRILLHPRDSHGDALHAATAAVDLLKNVQVKAILGAFPSKAIDFVVSLGDEGHVPIITFTGATSPYISSIQSQYLFRTSFGDSSQVRAIAAIIQAFRWRQVVPFIVGDEFGQRIVPYLSDALEQIGVHIPYRSVIPSSATDDQIAAELYKVMTMQTRIFIVHMASPLGSRLFLKAQHLGMMSGDYAWIITNAMANQLDSISPLVLKSMDGVLGVRPHVRETKELENFRVRYNNQKNGTFSHHELNIFGLLAYDTATALAIAVENAVGLTEATFSMPNVSDNATDLEKIGVFSGGLNLVQALSITMFTGLAGRFQLVDHQLLSPAYEVVNVVDQAAKVVGYWTKENGIVEQINSKNNDSSSYYASKTSWKSIIWPGIKYSPPKGWVLPVNEKKLRVLVPVKDGFSEFVRVNKNADNSTHVDGFCPDVFDEVVQALPYGLPYEYIPFAWENNILEAYDDLIDQLYLGKCDAIVGDMTITANRSQYVDFSIAFSESGISMIVPYTERKNKAWMFLQPLSWQLWIISFCSFIFIGIIIWVLEHRINKDFGGPLWNQLGMIFWFAFSTMVFSHKGTILSNYSRALLILWFFLVLILTQSYTASLSSLLTVQQLQPSIADVNTLIRSNAHVGYQDGSFLLGFLTDMKFNNSRLLSYNSSSELHELFQKGSENGGIAAAFDEIPYLKRFLAEYCSRYTMVGPIYKTGGFGFAFPRESPIVPDISRALLNITERGIMTRIESTWLGDSSACSSTSVSSTRLGLESFWGSL